NVEYGRVDVRVAERARLFAGDAPDLSNQLLVPSAPLARLRRKTRRGVGGQSPYAFVCEIRWDAEARVFDEEALHLVHGPDMFPYVRRVDALRPLLYPAVQLLVNVGDAVLPNFLLPLRSRRRKFGRTASPTLTST